MSRASKYMFPEFYNGPDSLLTSALREGRSDYWEKPLGEIANLAAAGDREAQTIMKLVKGADKKAQKYGRK